MLRSYCWLYIQATSTAAPGIIYSAKTELGSAAWKANALPTMLHFNLYIYFVLTFVQKIKGDIIWQWPSRSSIWVCMYICVHVLCACPLLSKTWSHLAGDRTITPTTAIGLNAGGARSQFELTSVRLYFHYLSYYLPCGATTLVLRGRQAYIPRDIHVR